MKAILDTNILVYAHDPGEPDRQGKAITLLLDLRLRGAGLLSVQSLGEFFSAITRPKDGNPPRLSPREALEQITRFASAFEILDVTPFIVLEAGRGVRDHQLSYHDAQIWATARLNQAPLVLSEDFQDGQVLEGVRFVNPFTPDFDLDNWL